MQIDIVRRLCRCRQHSTLIRVSCSGNKHSADLSINALRFRELKCTTLRQIYGMVLVTTPRVGIAERLLLLKISTTVGGAGKPAAAPRSAYGFGKYEWRRN